MTTILKGDTSKAITIALSDGFDYSGKTVVVEYQGVRRSFSNAAAGGSITFSFSAAETAPMSLGAYPVRVWIEGGGEVLTAHNADVKLRVTDCIADVHGGGAIYLDVHGGLHGIEGLPERFTDEDLRSKVNEIVRRLGGAVAIAVLSLLPVFGSTVEVHTAPKGTIYNDQQVVTNVTVDVSDKADATNVYTKVEADARIVELSPPTDLTPSTNYTDHALSSFAATGAVFRAATYGTPTRWTDATGCVWEVVDVYPTSVQIDGYGTYTNNDVSGSTHRWGASESVYVLYNAENGKWEYYNALPEGGGVWIATSSIAVGSNTITLDNAFGGSSITMSYSGYGWITNLVGMVALTNDLPSTNGFLRAESDPNVPSWAKASSKPSYSWSEITGKPNIPATAADVGATTSNDVESIIRERSLNGIWDSKLGVWWTPIMENGAYRWTATTNVNMNLEGD